MLLIESVFWILLTMGVLLIWMAVQRKVGWLLLNPLLLTVICLAALLTLLGMSHTDYYERTWVIDALLEPSVVVLGYPLYKQLKTIGQNWWQLGLVSFVSVLFCLSVGSVFASVIGLEDLVIKSLVVMATTTPIAIETAEAMQGSGSLASFLVSIGGLSGSAFGLTILTLFGVRDERSRGLAIGAFSHVIGAATVARESYTSTAYASVALIMCATMTALIAPVYVPFLLSL